MEELLYLAIILVLGSIATAIGNKLKVSNVFFLVLLGMVLGVFELVEFENKAIITISILALILIIFDTTLNIKIEELKKFYKDALKLVIGFFIFNMLVLGAATYLIVDFKINGLILSGVFAALMFGIDPGVALAVLGNKKNRVIEVLELEALMNTPITVIIPIILMNVLSTGNNLLAEIQNQTFPLLKQMLIPIIVAGIIGYMILQMFEHYYFGTYSNLVALCSAIISYTVSELFGGNGVIAVTVFGIVLGNYLIKHTIELKKYEAIFTGTLEILVFVLIGTLLISTVDERTLYLLGAGTVLFVIYFLIRYFTVITMISGINHRERFFMAINVPKGIDVAVVILLMITTYSTISGIDIIKNLSLLFVLYSIVLSTIGSVFAPWFFEKSYE